jgi:hypothetical protein
MVVEPHTIESARFGGLGGGKDISPLRPKTVQQHVDVHERP